MSGKTASQRVLSQLSQIIYRVEHKPLLDDFAAHMTQLSQSPRTDKLHAALTAYIDARHDYLTRWAACHPKNEMDSKERIKRTAQRVGLSVPEQYEALAQSNTSPNTA